MKKDRDVAVLDQLRTRFCRYAAIDTRADPDSGVTPSSPGQMVLAEMLAGELREMGLADAAVDAHAYVTASLPARNAAPGSPVIGLLAHLDTATEFSGANVNPRVIPDYDGSDIEQRPGMTLSPAVFPALLAQKGKTLLVTRGDTLLGGDDKGGIAIIMSVLDELLTNPDAAHGPVRIAFVPDEEIGHGAALLDLERFGADFAYTVDGSGTGDIEYENFNAAKAHIDIKGLAIHPGYAKGKMVNAAVLATEFMASFPENERPDTTEQREGFYHVIRFGGSVGHATIEMILRDHDKELFENRKAFVRKTADALNRKYPAEDGPRFTVTLTDQYRNMLEALEPHMHVVRGALEAVAACGLKPIVRPVRGGTDGARLSWRGLPCPNIFTGYQNAHGPYEFISLEDMAASVRVVLHVLRTRAEKAL